VAGQFGQLRGLQLTPAMGVKRLKEARRETARRAQTRSCRNICERCDFDLRSLEIECTTSLANSTCSSCEYLRKIPGVNGRITVT
jgi:hypothetical protein